MQADDIVKLVHFKRADRIQPFLIRLLVTVECEGISFTLLHEALLDN